MTHSLEVYYQNQLIFFSDRNWIYPLFELEKFLQTTGHPVQELLVQDKIVGKAAALLLVYFGISRIRAQLISRLGMEILTHFKVNYEYQQTVDRIYCQTEELLQQEMDPSNAYRLLSERIESIKHNRKTNQL
ncbi:MAG: hypothetical protein A2Y94_03015 [Caldithrix sp. RBG_13_44_9]|nr:MAG: hypothetical protein A2Y94_03015 [Caldithrix sp. RBG_13_44_9]